MPILQNIRHERFCQAVVSGQSLEKAYETAGFRPSRKNAWTLRQRKDISGRINDLIAQINAAESAKQARAIEKAAISRADVLKMLVEQRQAAHAANQHGPAVRAIELLGKELGMFIERNLTKQTDDIFESMDDAELRRLALERARQLADEDGETRH